jgi:PhnB protein
MTSYPIPHGYPTISPYFVVRDGEAAMEFYIKAFGGVVHRIDRNADGGINTVEMHVGTSMIMVGQSKKAVVPAGGMPSVGMYMYVEDVDAVFERGVAAGATVQNPPTDQHYGDRRADIVDPFGFMWWIASRIENFSPDEVQRRAQEHGK